MASIVEIIFKTIKEGSGDKETKDSLKGTKDAINDLTGSNLASITAWGAVGLAIGAATKYLIDAEQGAAEAAQQQAKLNAVLAATNGAAGLTETALNSLADEISRSAGIEDDLVKSSEAVLLTFTQVNKSVFPDTMKAAADMAAVLGGDLQGAVIQVGKAMNDFTGYTALKRAGVSFTEEQVKQIEHFKETNDLASYQKLVLGELQREFGGAAKAINQAGDGSKDLDVAWKKLSDAIGARLVPGTRSFKEALAAVYNEMADNISEANKHAAILDEVAKKHGLNSDQMMRARASSKAFNEEIEHQVDILTLAAGMAEISEDRFDKMGNAIMTAGEKAATASTDYEALLKSAQNNQQATDKYNKSLADLNTKNSELQSQIDTLISQGWSPLSQKVLDLKNKQADLATQMKETQATYSQAIGQMTLDQLRLTLAADGTFDSMDYQKYLDAAEAMGIMDQKSVDLAKAQNKLADMFAAGKINAQQLAEAINLLPSGKTVDVIMNMVVAATEGGRAPSRAENSPVRQGGPVKQMAGGGSFVVPPQYGYEGFSMGGVATASAGETVTVSPQGGQSSPAFDMREFARIIAEELDRRIIGV